MDDGLLPEHRRERLVHELFHVVRLKASDGVTDAGQEFRRCRGYVDRTHALEGVGSFHLHRAYL